MNSARAASFVALAASAAELGLRSRQRENFGEIGLVIAVEHGLRVGVIEPPDPPLVRIA